MRGSALVLALSLAGVAPGAVEAAEPAKARDAAGAATDEELRAAAWEARLSQAHAELVRARALVATHERELGIARHRKYPRGEALDELIAALAASRERLASAEAELPELLEQARRAGVSPGVLRRYEPEEE